MATKTKKKRDKKFDQRKADRMLSRSKVVHTFTLEAANNKPLSDTEIDRILMPVLGAMDALQFGELTSDGFIDLNEANCIAWNMGRVVLQDGGQTPGNVEVAMALKNASEKAATALEHVGTRFVEKDRFIATGDELQDVRDSIAWYRRLLEVLDSGQVIRAMKDGAQMVSEAINNGGRRIAKAA